MKTIKQKIKLQKEFYMQLNNDKNCYCKRKQKRICQGDIIRELNLTISSRIGNVVDFSLTPSFSYGVILSQECDIYQHYNRLKKNLEETDEDKKSDDQVIETLLVCPAFPLEQFLLGEHIEGKKMTICSSKKMEKIKDNDIHNRFHYLPKLEGRLPELIVDFKRFYTIPLGIFDGNLEKFYITSIKDLYRERLSQRFTNYLGRIALPNGEI